VLMDTGVWQGKGTLLNPGSSLGLPLAGTLEVVAEAGAWTITGSCALEGALAVPFSVRLHLDHEGVWTVAVFSAVMGLEGTAKIESEPHLALLWSESGHRHLTLTLFSIAGGVGCRGFLREAGAVRTWEIAWRREATSRGAGNVFSLRPFRRRT
jgi:hypothetical protein